MIKLCECASTPQAATDIFRMKNAQEQTESQNDTLKVYIYIYMRLDFKILPSINE